MAREMTASGDTRRAAATARLPLPVHARVRIPITVGGAARCVLEAIRAPRLRTQARTQSESYPPGVVVCLSVRSAFTALLASLNIGPGDEVAMSAVTIGDMGAIPAAFGATVVPVALEPSTLAPCPVSLAAAITPRTKVFVAAHLFGARPSLARCAAVAREHGVCVVVDAAQAFAAGDEAQRDLFAGDPDADVTLTSFGPLKTSTVLGGCIAACADPARAKQLERIQSSWPTRSRRAHAVRGLKYMLISILSRPFGFGVVMWMLRLRGVHPDAFVGRFTRGFGVHTCPRELRIAVSKAPDAGLRASLRRMLRQSPSRHLQQRIAIGHMVRAQLGSHIPGGAVEPHASWLLPIQCPSLDVRTELRDALLRERFDSVPIEATNLVDLAAIEQPGADQDGPKPSGAESLTCALMMPSLHGMSKRRAQHLCTTVVRVLGPPVHVASGEPSLQRVGEHALQR